MKPVSFCTIALVALGTVFLTCAPEKKKLDKKAFAAVFYKKTWYYSIDDGNIWNRGAQVDSIKFTPEGDPIHFIPVWIRGEWVDENTINWTAIDSTKAIWKSFDTILSDADKEKWKTFATAFPQKKWYYSVDDGAHWTEITSNEVKGFDENGAPLHIDGAWLPGQWRDENTIAWRAINNSESLWKAFDTPPPGE